MVHVTGNLHHTKDTSLCGKSLPNIKLQRICMHGLVSTLTTVSFNIVYQDLHVKVSRCFQTFGINTDIQLYTYM